MEYKQVRVIGLATMIPMYLIAGPIVGYFIGKWIDHKLAVHLWGTAIMLILGFAAGVRQAILTLKEINYRSSCKTENF